MQPEAFVCFTFDVVGFFSRPALDFTRFKIKKYRTRQNVSFEASLVLYLQGFNYLKLELCQAFMADIFAAQHCDKGTTGMFIWLGLEFPKPEIALLLCGFSSVRLCLFIRAAVNPLCCGFQIGFPPTQHFAPFFSFCSRRTSCLTTREQMGFSRSLTLGPLYMFSLMKR